MQQLNGTPASALLRDYKPENVAAARRLAGELGLQNVTAEQGDAFDRKSLAALAPKPTIAIISGLFELFPANEPVLTALRGVADAVAPGGYLVYTNQPWHPQVEFIARVLTNREGKPWIMRRRTQAEMDELVRACGLRESSTGIGSMGHFHRVARPANFRMNKPTKLSALGASVGLSLCFIVVYGACNYLTAHRTDVGMWHFEWEKYIPLLTWFIVPYMSIDLFFAAAPFLCKSREELAIHAKRIVFAILIAGGIFLIMPLKLVITRPEPTDWTGPIFQFLHSFDEPHNLFPSLHITLRAILADLYARRTKGGWRVAMHVWFSLIGFSTILVGQHHVPDVLGGFVLAAFCLYLFPTAQPVAPGLAASSPLARYYIGAPHCVMGRPSSAGPTRRGFSIRPSP
jgi:membrane-associated phospholipid phosphatase